MPPARLWCPRHGYRHDDLDAKTGCTNKYNAKGKLPVTAASQPVTRLRPPDLIVQDEMHLISGALGTTVGLFEAAVDELCTWPLPGAGAAGPKIVASTATTKRAREQVLGVFGRELAVFPPPVVDITDTFFSKQVPLSKEHPGRRYLGVCGHGVRLKSAEIRLAEILLLAGQTLFDAKQHTGVGQARNRTPTAVRRTVPFGLYVHSIVIIWHATAGHHPEATTPRPPPTAAPQPFGTAPRPASPTRT